MGRTNGRLISFLKEALLMGKYINLTYVSETEFRIELPRYEPNMKPEYEVMLKDWYKVNGRLEKYENYSVAKSVFQAALKKSIYLISLPKMGKKLQYQFSSSEQIEAKRNALKGKSIENPPSVSSSGYLSSTDDNDLGSSPIEKSVESPSSVASVGYHSGSDDNDLGNWLDLDEFFQINNNVPPPAQVNDDQESIDHLKIDKYLESCLKNPISSDSSEEISMEEKQEFPYLELLQNLPNISDKELSQILDGSSTGNLDFSTTEDGQHLPVAENLPAAQEMDSQQPVVQASSRQNIWVCTQKIQIGSLMQLVCEPAMPGVENDEGIPETIFFNGMLEAGQTYNFKKKLRVDKYLFLILTCLG